MLAWLFSNIATVIISIILICLVTLIIKKLIKDKKSGRSPCGGDCGHCPMGGSCHGGK